MLGSFVLPPSPEPSRQIIHPRLEDVAQQHVTQQQQHVADIQPPPPPTQQYLHHRKDLDKSAGIGAAAPVYPVPVDVLQMISKDLGHLAGPAPSKNSPPRGRSQDSEQLTGSLAQPTASYAGKTETSKPSFSSTTGSSTSRSGTTAGKPLPRNAVAKISVRSDKETDTTCFTIIPVARRRDSDGSKENEDDEDESSASPVHTFTVNTSDVDKATRMLKPLLRDRMPFLKKLFTQKSRQQPSTSAKEPPRTSSLTSTAPRPTSSTPVLSLTPSVPALQQPPFASVPLLPITTSPAPSAASNNNNSVVGASTDVIRIKEVTVDKSQGASLKALAGHGIVLDGMTCATTEGGQKYWICPEGGCRKAYTRPSKLKIHLLVHRDIRPFRCPVRDCDWGFVTNSKLQRHLDSHTNQKNKKRRGPGRTSAAFLCREKGCNGHEFASQKGLLRHHKDKHGGRKKEAPPALNDFFCSHSDCVSAAVDTLPELRIGFNTANELRAHERMAHPTDKSGRGEVFSPPKANSSDGKKSVGGGGPLRARGGLPFACLHPSCGWTFASASKLRRHERSHAGERARRHACSVCGKAFTRQEHLRSHLFTHTPSKRFLCPFAECGSRFTQKSGLYVHLRQKHGDAILASPPSPQTATYATCLLGPGRFRCPVEGCSRASIAGGSERVFPSRAELAQHVATFHKSDFVNPVEKGGVAGGGSPNPKSLLLTQPAAGKQILALLSPQQQPDAGSSRATTVTSTSMSFSATASPSNVIVDPKVANYSRRDKKLRGVNHDRCFFLPSSCCCAPPPTPAPLPAAAVGP